MGLDAKKRAKIQSGARLKAIRKNADMTQEKFSEIMEISLSAYKKLESGENQISIDSLRKLVNKMDVSADYILFGESNDFASAWKGVMNCAEADKMMILLRLVEYFTETKGRTYSMADKGMDEMPQAQHILKETGIYHDAEEKRTNS